LEDVLETIQATGFTGKFWLVTDCPCSGAWVAEVDRRFYAHLADKNNGDTNVAWIKEVMAYSACNEKENVPWTNFTTRLTPQRTGGLFIKGVTPLLSTYVSGN